MAEIFVKNFNQISQKNTESAGGKGASLGEMMQAGVPVPEGFVILSNSFDTFIEETNLNVEIEAVLDRVDVQKADTLEKAFTQIQGMILIEEIPHSIKKEILEFYKKLDCKFVAVRSSATCEDSISAAWAGQLDSFLNTTEDSFLGNVKKCWASLFTPRAIFYRFEKKLVKEKISVAVVVQKMVESEESGVAFSVHPITRDEDQMIIEAGFGLGEAVVSGQITPDTYIVTKKIRRIIDKNIANQERGLFKSDRGGNEWKDISHRGLNQKLLDKQIFEISEMIIKIENHYGFPCDIEWAYEKQKLFILQSRPITTLPDFKDKKTIDPQLGLVLKSGMPDLTKYTLTKIVRRDNSPFFNSLMRVGSTIQNPQLGFDSRMFVHIILDKDIYYAEEDLKNLEKRMIDEWKGDKNFFKNYFEKVIKDCSHFVHWSKTTTDFSDFSKIYKEFTQYSLSIMNHLWPCVAPEKWILQKIESELTKYIDPEKDFKKFQETVILLTSPSELSEMNLKKKEIFQGKDVREVYEKYVWATDQSFSLHYESFEDFKKGLGDIKSSKEKADKMEEEILELKRQQQEVFPEYQLSKEFISFCECAQMLPHIRLLRRDCIIEAGYNLRKFFSEMQKALPLSDLTLAYYWEIRDLLEGKEVDVERIEKRKKTYSFILIDHDFYEYDEETGKQIKNKIESPTDFSAEIRGQTACLGKVTGVARVLHSAKEIHLVQKGEILVTSMTTPDFVPAMQKAIAFVTDEGGLSCHAAIIAREMKKPCVIGTKHATKVICDGDLVEVDANLGIVRIL